MRTRSNLRHIRTYAEGLGYSYLGKTSKGHYRFRAPAGAVVITGSELGDWRVIKNVRANLRRFRDKPSIYAGHQKST